MPVVLVGTTELGEDEAVGEPVTSEEAVGMAENWGIEYVECDQSDAVGVGNAVGAMVRLVADQRQLEAAGIGRGGDGGRASTSTVRPRQPGTREVTCLVQ